MNILDFLAYAAVVKALAQAAKTAPKGTPVPVPTIKGIRAGKRSFTFQNGELVPENEPKAPATPLADLQGRTAR